MSTQKPGFNHFLFPLFVLISLLGGILITSFAFLIGGVYSILSEPADSKITPDDVAGAIMIGNVIYILAISSLTIYAMRKERINRIPRFLLFIATPYRRSLLDMGYRTISHFDIPYHHCFFGGLSGPGNSSPLPPNENEQLKQLFDPETARRKNNSGAPACPPDTLRTCDADGQRYA